MLCSVLCHNNFLGFKEWFSFIVKLFITHMLLKWVQKKSSIENQGFATEKWGSNLRHKYKSEFWQIVSVWY